MSTITPKDASRLAVLALQKARGEKLSEVAKDLQTSAARQVARVLEKGPKVRASARAKQSAKILLEWGQRGKAAAR